MRQQPKTFLAGVLVGALLAASATAVGQGSKVSDEMRAQLRRLTEAFGAIKANFVTEVQDSTLVDGCIAGMLRKIDTHSGFLDAAEFRKLQVGSGAQGGLGFEMVAVGDRFRVVAPIEGTPADRAGIRTGDFVVKVEDTDTAGMALSEVFELLRGAPGSRVRVTVLRAGVAAPLEIPLTREILRPPSLRARLAAPGIGYVRISQFRETVPEAFSRALQGLRAENGGALRGLVLDLRGNPGGLLNTGVDVAAAFLQEGQLVLTMEGRTEDARRRYTVTPGKHPAPEDTRRLPLVVLINNGSAAASEIVAGALQDHKRAVILGERSFGRGSIQTIMPFADGSALRLTTSYWHTPSGRQINTQGIAPDVVIDDASMRPASPSGYGAPGDTALKIAIDRVSRP